MEEKIQIKAVDMVRSIRDQQAEMLKGKSKAEIMDFFREAGEAARNEAEKSGPHILVEMEFHVAGHSPMTLQGNEKVRFMEIWIMKSRSGYAGNVTFTEAGRQGGGYLWQRHHDPR